LPLRLIARAKSETKWLYIPAGFNCQCRLCTRVARFDSLCYDNSYSFVDYISRWGQTSTNLL